MARLCIVLAQTVADLKAWGHAHAAILASLPAEVLTIIRAAYADQMAGLRLKEIAQ